MREEKKGMKKEELIKIIDNLYQELNKRENGDSYIYDYKGEMVSLDIGYAFEGIEFFIDELKHKLNESEEI